MTDYNKLTVKDLKALLKERGIAQTGLTRKAQYVDALEKADAPDEAAPDEAAPGASGAPQAAVEAGLSGVDAEEQASEREPDGNGGAQTADAEARTGDADAHADSVTPGVTTAAPIAEPPLAGEDVEPTAEVTQGQEGPTEPEALPSLTHTSTLESVQPEELIEDRLKRKRRSATPPVSDSEVAKKKVRQDNGAGSVHLREDLSQNGHGDLPNESVATDAGRDEGEQAEPATADIQQPADHGASGAADARGATATKEREGRYKDLLPSQAQAEPEHAPGGDDDRAVAPAIHPASSAIYISNLQRPLSPATLRSHLISLAAPPDTDSDPESIRAFFVDSVKSHAFALFDAVNAASRVRASLHGRTWPAERDRKPLWIDFIPEDKCEEWIAFEDGGSRGSRSGPGTRWEVAYDQDENGVTARLVEFGTSAQRKPSQQQLHRDAAEPEGKRPPTAPAVRPAAPESVRTVPRPVAPAQPERESRKFVNLDKAFRFTASKPKLYFLPVARDLAEKRLDEFESVTSRDWSGKRAGAGDDDQLRRYTFEDGDVLVDSGFHPMPGRSRGGGGGGGRGGRGGFTGYGPGPPRRGGYGGDDGAYGSYRSG